MPSATTGLDHPRPGTADFQTTFWESDQTSGVAGPTARPSAFEPRNSVQSPTQHKQSKPTESTISQHSRIRCLSNSPIRLLYHHRENSMTLAVLVRYAQPGASLAFSPKTDLKASYLSNLENFVRLFPVPFDDNRKHPAP
jgi:hypothetical protein